MTNIEIMRRRGLQAETPRSMMSMCMTEDQYVQKMMEWVSMREKKKLIQIARVHTGRPRWTDNLIPASSDMQQRQGRLLPYTSTAF